MYSVGFKLGEDATRVARLIVGPFSTPVIITTFCDNLSPLCDELDKSDKLEVIGWQRTKHNGQEIGARIKFKSDPGLIPSDLVGIVTDTFSEVYASDIRIFNERYENSEEIIV